MKLKLIAAVVGLVLSAASQAAITPTTTIGGSDLLLNVWEQGAPGGQPDQSFTFDLGVTFNQYVTTLSATNTTLATLLSTDSTWTNFLASSDVNSLQWSVIASGNKVNTRPAIFGTSTVGTDPTTAGTSGFLTNLDLNNANVQVATYINNLNVNLVSPNEQVNLKGSGAYYQDWGLATFNDVAFSNGNAIGASDISVWTASNLAGGNTTAAVMNQLVGKMAFTQVNGNYVLTVSAVPEAPAGGMALCGLVALGFLAARRRNAV